MNKRWDALTAHLPRNTKLTGAEIGVWQVQMSEQFLRMNPGLFLILVDRWCCPPPGDSYFEGSRVMSKHPQEKFDRAYADTIRRVTPFADRVKVYKMTSVQAAPRIEDGSLDFVFIDGDHSYKGVTTDLELWVPKVRQGGLISGHDWGNAGTFQDVEHAVRDFFGDIKGVETGVNNTWFRR